MRRWGWPKIARTLVLLVLTGLVVFVVGLVVDRLGRKPVIVDMPADPISPTKVDFREQGSVVEYRGDQSKVEAKFDKHYKGQDGLDHLEGRVLIVDYGKTGGRELRMAGDAATYDQEWTSVRVRGNASVQIKGLTIASSEFDYDRTTGSVRTAAGAILLSPRVVGTARRMSYTVEAEEIVLEDNLDCTLIPRNLSRKPVRVTGRRFLFNQKERRGRVEDDVAFVQGKNRGKAARIAFELFPANDNLSRVELSGGAEIEAEDPKAAEKAAAGTPTSPTAGFTDFISFRAERQTLTADRIILLPFENTDKIQAVLLRGKSGIRLASGGGNTTDLVGESIEIIYLPGGDLRDFTLEGSTRIRGYQAASKLAKTLEGTKMTYHGSDRLLKIRGTADRPAKFDEPSRSLTCGILALYFRLNSFDAAERVTIVSTPGEGERGTSGFFTRSQPVFIRADAARYDDPKKSFWISGGVKMWQGRESLLVGEMTIREETGEMHGTGGVKSIFAHQSKSKEKVQERRVEIEAGTLDFDPQAKKLHYGAKGALRMDDVGLKAESIAVDLVDGEIRRVLATNNVTVIQGTREATGDQAVYDTAAEQIALTGRPALKDKDKGSVLGEKLTFFLSDGKIVVENRDGERSLTKIK